ncbi:Broad-complex core protein isoforms 1/2/3/4/5 [Gryllus bimaculatus]|nr:Broad-complex core protein isoforms 1/2/3/4/5 [Gryllus bimaculatus]
MATDQFCLRWNNFQVNITSALESLKNDEDLVDVTLTCEGQNVKAHKVILAACSPYFRNVFKENPCQHPVVILKDVKYEDVTALLSFMYHGEVYITQDRLASFLHTAELLQVRGLTGAGNPLKDFPVPPQPPALAKKIGAPPPSAALRRETPPPPPPPAARAARSPLVSPPPKDSASHDADGELPAKSAHQVLPVPALFFTSNGQPGTLYSVLNPDQTATLAAPLPANAATFQLLSSNSCAQLSPRFSSVSGQSLTQPSSPSATKRRKTLPRRFSSCIVPSAPSESSFNKSEREKDPLRDSGECVEAEGAFKEVEVKVEEPSGDEMLSEGDEARESAGDGDGDGDGSEVADQQEEQDECAERLLEGDAPLLSPPAGKPPPPPQRDDRVMSLLCPFCFKTISNKSNLLKHMKIRHSGLCLQQQCQICEIENFNVSHESNMNISPSSIVLQQSVMSANNINYKNELNSNQPWLYTNRMLYHKKKRSWHSRRPVPCPNCNKTITMAYNLKSHLNSCLKRFDFDDELFKSGIRNLPSGTVFPL